MSNEALVNDLREVIKTIQEIAERFDVVKGRRPLIISRDLWIAENVPFSNDSLGVIKTITLHHSAGTYPKTHDDAKRAVKGIQQYHMHQRHWSDIGYHYLVSPSGDIFEGRQKLNDGTYSRGAHSGGNNSNNLGICVLGDYTTEKLTDRSKQAVSDLVDFIRQGNTDIPVKAHRDFKNTLCPGFSTDWIK